MEGSDESPMFCIEYRNIRDRQEREISSWLRLFKYNRQSLYMHSVGIAITTYWKNAPLLTDVYLVIRTFGLCRISLKSRVQGSVHMNLNAELALPLYFSDTQTLDFVGPAVKE